MLCDTIASVGTVDTRTSVGTVDRNKDFAQLLATTIHKLSYDCDNDLDESLTLSQALTIWLKKLELPVMLVSARDLSPLASTR